MESSLASLFMDGNLPCLPLSWATSGESVEELQQQLTSTSLELQSAREAARLESKVNEAKVRGLQSLLDAARKERDEARTKCSKLQECLWHLSRSSQVPAAAAESPSRFLPSSISSTSSPMQFSHPASPNMDTTALQDVKPTVCVEEGGSIFGIDVAAKQLPHQAPDVQDIFVLDQNAYPSCITVGDSQQQFSMDILNEDVSLDEDESLELIDLQVEHSTRSSWEQTPSSKASWGGHASDDSNVGSAPLRQSSCVSTAGSESLVLSEPLKVPTSVSKQPVILPSQMFPVQSATAPSHASSHPRVTPEVSSFANQTAELHAYVERSEPEVSIVKEDALPEKGKLLQAVMQAGPLLQNLLLAGPLPQWRYPPPQLSTVDIPKVPMVSGSVSQKYSSLSLASIGNHALPTHHNPLLNYPRSAAPASAPQFADEKGVLLSSSALASMMPSKSGRNTCYGGRKLRRLSPIGVK